MDKVSVVIPTYNRFNFLMNAIESIKNQTYKNIEIIVVNDRSTQKEYYEYDWTGIKVIHLDQNSKTKFGFACPGGYQRNFGIKIAEGKYIAFCDDDDIWLPQKLELQLAAMKKTGCKMSSTDGYIGSGVYNKDLNYRKYNATHCYSALQDIYKRKGSSLFDNGFPDIWTLAFMKVHNCMICSSVVIEKDIMDKTGEFIIAKHAEDYEYWLRALENTNSVYVRDMCFYYDSAGGGGKNYSWSKQ